MEIQIAALCDSAADYQGRLSMLGVFENITVQSFPAVHLHCAVVLRFVFRREDQGAHRLLLQFVDADGKPLMPPLDTAFPVEMPSEALFASRNVVLNLQNLRFEKGGQYSVDVMIDDRSMVSIPLEVRMLPAPAPAEAVSEN